MLVKIVYLLAFIVCFLLNTDRLNLVSKAYIIKYPMYSWFADKLKTQPLKPVI